ncbi:helix-turn-helix domain-containing protein [Verrucomicrobium sp. BvORR106]|uniref:helix-turn-helix transcriptional regulator n=1 Tax=Verrucomicrobium sp. BvORR106 TaxID=1403819 RepID=UPI000571ECF8|nr:helix-turn-helix domain-containing protein [Verrucomicrobium sp. BvORR106]
MNVLPYHHDWPLLADGHFGLQMHWFGRYAGYPEWAVERSRLAPQMMSFFFVESSSCWAEINGTRLELATGDFVIIKGGDEFEFGHDPRAPHVSLSASLAISQGGEPNVLLQRAFPRRCSWHSHTEFVSEFEKVLAVLGGTTVGQGFALHGAVLQWVAYLMRHLHAPLQKGAVTPGGRRGLDAILHAQRWATEHLAEEITLADWAAAAGMGAVYFGRLFKRETGRRPMEWLNERRLQLAVQQLMHSPRAVAEIAQDCGFVCPFYFSRVFRRRYGCPPSDVRRQPHQRLQSAL